MKIFKDKIVIITGGASGIGRELTKRLAAYGALCIIADKNILAAKSVQHELRALGWNAEFMEVDMTDIDQAKKLIESVVHKHGRLDYMLNGAGIVQGGEVRDTPLHDWYTVINTNMYAVMNGTHFAYQQMLRQGHGHIVNFASAAGLLPTPAMAIYAGSKFGIVGFTQSLRAEAAGLGIKVSVVCPGVVKTPIYETAIYNGLDKEKTVDVLFHKIPIQSPETAAHRILRGVARNKMIIHTWYFSRFGWGIYRLSPRLYVFVTKQALKSVRAKLRVSKAD